MFGVLVIHRFCQRKRSSDSAAGCGYARARTAADDERRAAGRTGAPRPGSERPLRLDASRRAGRERRRRARARRDESRGRPRRPPPPGRARNLRVEPRSPRRHAPPARAGLRRRAARHRDPRARERPAGRRRRGRSGLRVVAAQRPAAGARPPRARRRRVGVSRADSAGQTRRRLPRERRPRDRTPRHPRGRRAGTSPPLTRRPSRDDRRGRRRSRRRRSGRRPAGVDDGFRRRRRRVPRRRPRRRPGDGRANRAPGRRTDAPCPARRPRRRRRRPPDPRGPARGPTRRDGDGPSRPGAGRVENGHGSARPPGVGRRPHRVRGVRPVVRGRHAGDDVRGDRTTAAVRGGPRSRRALADAGARLADRPRVSRHRLLRDGRRPGVAGGLRVARRRLSRGGDPGDLRPRDQSHLARPPGVPASRGRRRGVRRPLPAGRRRRRRDRNRLGGTGGGRYTRVLLRLGPDPEPELRQSGRPDVAALGRRRVGGRRRRLPRGRRLGRPPRLLEGGCRPRPRRRLVARRDASARSVLRRGRVRPPLRHLVVRGAGRGWRRQTIRRRRRGRARPRPVARVRRPERTAAVHREPRRGPVSHVARRGGAACGRGGDVHAARRADDLRGPRAGQRDDPRAVPLARRRQRAHGVSPPALGAARRRTAPPFRTRRRRGRRRRRRGRSRPGDRLRARGRDKRRVRRRDARVPRPTARRRELRHRARDDHGSGPVRTGAVRG
ncbi:MAG: hypothetical protein A07HR67_02203 [uncultured archaeon A07HR67]|nr:MAG: hypothetical protein A07HR67_02203 [uncultured archaeon A07HR67]